MGPGSLSQLNPDGGTWNAKVAIRQLSKGAQKMPGGSPIPHRSPLDTRARSALG
jgi:hypothetical protein